MGFEAAGMTISWQCELDAWKRSVLAAHYPNIPIYEDITTLEDPEPVDLMVGGFPCQDLSIAGQRKGFSGERSVLAFEFLRIAEALKPRWLVLENVPGLLSSNKGLDFQRLLREMVASGYGGIAWRCLDARYFGVPQRRRRIFLVARRAEVGVDPRTASGLALRALCESGSGDTTPCIPPWQDATRAVEGGVGESGVRTNRSDGVSDTVRAKWSKGTGGPSGDECQNIISFYSTGGSQNGFWATDGVSNTLKIGSSLDIPSPVAIAYRKSARVNADPDSPETWVDDGRANTLNKFYVGDVRTTHAVVANALDRQQGGAGDNSAQVGDLVPHDRSVRRLTPVECERLMGWPRNWTAPEGVKASDSRRYAACGDGIVANVAFWIGQRIMQIDEETHGK